MEREELIKELEHKACIHANDSGYDYDMGIVADWIIADRKRIVEPLLTPHTIHKGNELEICIKAIKQTLKNAGVKE